MHVHALLYLAWCSVTRGGAHVSGGMATPYGQIVAFHHESDSIKAYLEHVQLYFVANRVPEDVQVPIFLSCIGVPTYSLLSDLFAPSAPSSKSFQVIRHYAITSSRSG